MSRDVLLALRDRFFDYDELTWSIVDWLKAHPDAHPDEREAKFATWETLEKAQFRLLEREQQEVARSMAQRTR